MLLKLTTALLFPLSCFGSCLLNDMTVEEKVGQLLLVHFHGTDANEEARTLIHELHIGGIIYYNWANGLDSPQQVQNLSNHLQDLAQQTRLRVPLLIAVDQEGGRVTRLKEGFTQPPSNQVLGMTHSPSLAQEYAWVVGKELQSVGINFNLAPVVDIHMNPLNPVIGDRSFGNTATLVTAFAHNALIGYQKAHILTCLKHFPGHGDTQVDSHCDLPSLYKSKEQLLQAELLPFMALAPHTDTVMTAHLMIPSLDPVNCATLSQPILDILRKEIGFEGVIITDSLVMEGLLKNCRNIEEAALQALNAGCDLLTLGGKQLIGANAHLELSVKEIKQIHQSLVHAIDAGTLSQHRLDEAVNRILKLKKNLKPAATQTPCHARNLCDS